VISATVFESIIAPLKPLLSEQAKGLKGDDYTLSFYFFTVNLIYAVVARVTSISLLVTHLKSHDYPRLPTMRYCKIQDTVIQVKPNEAQI